MHRQAARELAATQAAEGGLGGNAAGILALEREWVERGWEKLGKVHA